MAYLKYDQKIPEPVRPLPEGKTEHANDRGTRIHSSCEDFISGKASTLAPEADKFFGPQIELLRAMYADGIVSLEGEWAMNRSWDPVDWHGQWIEEPGAPATSKVKTLPLYGKPGDTVAVGKRTYSWEPAWLRLKLDAAVFHSRQHATVIDFKSGKKYGNEIKHGQQLQLYQLVTFLRYPLLERVDAELWYLDQNDTTKVSFTRAQGLRFHRTFDQQGREVTSDWVPTPNPSLNNCRFCPFGERPDGHGTGHCKRGVYK